MSERWTEAAIIGAGPIGLEVAVGLQRAGIDYLHFDARQIGYTISWFAPQTRFFSSAERIAIAGVPLQIADQGKATREDYLAYLRGVVQQFDLKVRTYEPIVGIERDRDGGFVLTSRRGGGGAGIGSERKYCVRKLILATGGTDRPRRLGVPGEDLPHVSHYFHDPHTYFQKKLLIVGGKNSAAESAIRCFNAGAEITFSYRRSQLDGQSIKYWLLPEINGHIASGKIAAHFCTDVKAITPEHVILGPSSFPPESGPAKSEQKIEADFVLLLIGYEADLSLLRLAGVELRGDCDAPVFDPHTMQTTVPNIYVAGTAIGGTQDKYKVFIENCHVHAARIVAALTGASEPAPPAEFARPES